MSEQLMVATAVVAVADAAGALVDFDAEVTPHAHAGTEQHAKQRALAVTDGKYHQTTGGRGTRREFT